VIAVVIRKYTSSAQVIRIQNASGQTADPRADAADLS
jgi:3-deoxy-D-arabino-heptulosonate 7-phosphate (DAHP) synthase class II